MFQRATDVVLFTILCPFQLGYLQAAVPFSKRATERLNHLQLLLDQMPDARVLLNLKTFSYFEDILEVSTALSSFKTVQHVSENARKEYLCFSWLWEFVLSYSCRMMEYQALILCLVPSP